MTVFDASSNQSNTVTLIIHGEEITLTPPVSIETLKSKAVEHGIKKFTVENTYGAMVTSSDFPLTSGKFIIKEYNEAK